jgi:hypothetical protein
MHVDGQRVVMEVYGKVTAVADTSVTLRFTSIFMGEAEAYYNALLGLKDGEGD